MAPKVNKKQPKTKGQVEKKLQDKAAQALERERKHVQQTKARGYAAGVDGLV